MYHVCTPCMHSLDGLGMPVELCLGIVVPIFKGNHDMRNCSFNRTVMIREHGMIVVERVLEERLQRIVTID